MSQGFSRCVAIDDGLGAAMSESIARDERRSLERRIEALEHALELMQNPLRNRLTPDFVKVAS